MVDETKARTVDVERGGGSPDILKVRATESAQDCTWL